MRRHYARIGAASGAVCVLSVMVGNGLALAGWSGATDGPGVLADLQRDLSVVNIVGLSMELLGWVALVMFLGYLYRVLQRAEGPDGWLAPVAFGSGLIMVCIKLGSVAPLMAAWYRRDDLTVTTATTLSDLGGALFVVSGWATGLLVASAAGSALISRGPPALAWVGSGWSAASPPSWPAPRGSWTRRNYIPLPFLAGLLWILITSVVLTARASRVPQHDLTEAHCPHRCRGATMTV